MRLIISLTKVLKSRLFLNMAIFTSAVRVQTAAARSDGDGTANL